MNNCSVVLKANDIPVCATFLNIKLTPNTSYIVNVTGRSDVVHRIDVLTDVNGVGKIDCARLPYGYFNANTPMYKLFITDANNKPLSFSVADKSYLYAIFRAVKCNFLLNESKEVELWSI